MGTEKLRPDLLENPVCRADELGKPIPDSTHAVSVALPRWADVVAYEEKKPEVINRLQSGYPRFLIHPLISELSRRFEKGQPCLPFPSARAAGQCVKFVSHSTGAQAMLKAEGGVYAVITDETGFPALKAFWQHTGLIVSTRRAEAWLKGRTNNLLDTETRRSLRRQLADLYDCAEHDVFLEPSGMAAVFAALQALIQRTPGRPTVQLGFPYVDTFKLQQRLGHGGILLHHLESIEAELGNLVKHQPLAGCFCEILGNPLLGSVDLRRISPILREHRLPLVADDVVATPLNVDLGGYVDLIATSLTKFIAGAGDVMAGALICNPKSPLYPELKPILRAQHEELLWSDDVEVLEGYARDFPERMKQHNANGLWLAGQLQRHPAIQKVWYPKWEFSEAYEAVRRKDGGWGALVSFLPKNAARTAPEIYDRMEVCKGPSLGTTFTLACPFTLLAHYTELDWAEACGVSRYLIRLSVGLENPRELWGRIEKALDGRP